jgi:hypothetical protein
VSHLDSLRADVNGGEDLSASSWDSADQLQERLA